MMMMMMMMMRRRRRRKRRRYRVNMLEQMSAPLVFHKLLKYVKT